MFKYYLNNSRSTKGQIRYPVINYLDIMYDQSISSKISYITCL